jgi:hypothetical protein
VSESLGEALPKELERAREILGMYQDAGPAGRFGAAMISQSIKQADEAIISGDVAAMIVVYKDLQTIKC